MKIFVFVLISCWVFLQIQAVPVFRPAKSRTAHNKELFRELLCILKGKTAEECDGDTTVSKFMVRLFPSHSILSSSDTVEEEDVRTISPPGLPGVKRQAFYSDWK